MPKHYMGGPMMPPFDQSVMDPMQFGRPFGMDGGPVRGGMPGRGSGRGRGNWRPPGDVRPQGTGPDIPKSDQTTIVVENIPPEKCQLDSGNKYFKKFGTIVNININPQHQRAVVALSTHQEAQKASSSPEAVFDNRFVRIHWQESPSGPGQVPTIHPSMHHAPPPHTEPLFPSGPPNRGFAPMRGTRGRGAPRSHAVPIRPPPNMTKPVSTTTPDSSAMSKPSTSEGLQKEREPETSAPAPSTSAHIPSTSISHPSTSLPHSHNSKKADSSKRHLLHLQMEQRSLLDSQIAKQKAYLHKMEDLKRKLANSEISHDQFDREKATLMKGINTLQMMILKTKEQGQQLTAQLERKEANGEKVNGNKITEIQHVEAT